MKQKNTNSRKYQIQVKQMRLNDEMSRTESESDEELDAF